MYEKKLGVSGQYRSLTQIIVETIRDRIYDQQYGPGARLNISDLAEELEVSPVPVREALRNLEAEGLVQFRNNKGVTVRELSVEDVRELLIIRSPLECLAASAAALNSTERDADRLQALVEELDGNLETNAWHRLHAEFHQQLYSIGNLPRLRQIIDMLRLQMQPYSRLYLHDREHLKAAQREHHLMVECLRRHDTETIADIVRDHLARPARLAMSAVEKPAATAAE